MAARRLLIVMLILLGLSTLAAALVPQHALRKTTSGATSTRSVPTTPATPAPEAVPPVADITVGGRKFPVVPVHVGEQFTVLARSRFPTQLEIKAFGLFGFATKNTPARFELLADMPGTVGILFVPPHKVLGRRQEVAARIEVLPRGAKTPGKKGQRSARSRARAGSNRT